MAARKSNGQFAPGNQEWKKRRRNGPSKAEDMDNLVAVIDANVSPQAVAAGWKRISDAIEHGGRGWLDAFKFYHDRRYGRPDTYSSVDVTTGGEPIKGYVVVSPDDWPGDES